ncbi:hypothetical protein [[Limnothrix rosea] IAM M-220]|uniref:hypothetical protein n=1 Tax=[Limnothrix rosea] IAM M-220 TaxID=454133 RepID=UPI0009625659|nr:hypothetical protein [[Limnothrix rosea] IAM M-220]OKH17483.1 hypothetical protein NIES208_09075 [[Limnothrix rosea] IAM M-220]
MTSHPALPTIIREFEQHQDALRLKKLLIYAVENIWESDTLRLHRIDLMPIITAIPQKFPSLVHFREALNAAVNTLSRPMAYGRLATVIIKAIAPLYEQPMAQDDAPEGTTRIIMATPTSPPKDTSPPKRAVVLVAKQMERHPEGIRIKKLLFALCHQRWENDFQILGQASFLQLIRQIKDLYPHTYELAAALQSLVSSLNRQTIYASLSNFILEVTGPIYRRTDEPTGLTRPTFPPITIARPEAADAANSTYQGSMSFSAQGSQPSIPLPDISFGEISESYMSSEITDPRLQVTASLDEPSTGAAQQTSDITAASLKDPRNPQSAHFAKALNIFELKLEIMKYANPLRAKILLFSAVHHPFDLSGEDWSLLRTCDFDDLLHKTLQGSPSVVALEIRLSAIAQSLFEPKEHLQATSALIQAIKLLSQPTKTP